MRNLNGLAGGDELPANCFDGITGGAIASWG
jgi:hypothetical protein